jgi:hypothetical protein
MRAHEIEPCVQKRSVQIILFGAVFAGAMAVIAWK